MRMLAGLNQLLILLTAAALLLGYGWSTAPSKPSKDTETMNSITQTASEVHINGTAFEIIKCPQCTEKSISVVADGEQLVWNCQNCGHTWSKIREAEKHMVTLYMKGSPFSFFDCPMCAEALQQQKRMLLLNQAHQWDNDEIKIMQSALCIQCGWYVKNADVQEYDDILQKGCCLDIAGVCFVESGDK